MPNWTHNSLTVSHKDASAIHDLVSKVDADGELFNHILPMPENTFRGNLGNEEMEMCKREGIPNWYDWCCNNWGTKWDACHLDWNRIDEHTVTFDFDTAWAAPVPIWQALAEQGFEVEAYYVSYENWDAGVWEHDAEGNVYEDSSGDLSTYVPERVDEVFGVSDYLKEIA